MDTTSKEKFDSLIELDKNSLNRGELEFLMARRDYMNDVQRERFSKEIALHEKGNLFKSSDESVDDLAGLKLKELVALAEEEGLDIDTKGMKAPELVEAIRAARESVDEE